MAQTPENRLDVVSYALPDDYVSGPTAVSVEYVYPPISGTGEFLGAIASLGTVVDNKKLPDGAESFKVVPHSMEPDSRDEITRMIIDAHSVQSGGEQGQVETFKNLRDYQRAIEERQSNSAAAVRAAADRQAFLDELHGRPLW